MKVNEIMNKDVVTCAPTETLWDIINKLQIFNIGGLPVTEKGKKLVGIVTTKDILSYIAKSKPVVGIVSESEVEKLKRVKVEEVMKKDVFYVSPTDSVFDVARVMNEKGYNRVPVVDKGKVVGIVARGDILKAIVESL